VTTIVQNAAQGLRAAARETGAVLRLFLPEPDLHAPQETFWEGLARRKGFFG
jgi:hypothetical protein